MLSIVLSVLGINNSKLRYHSEASSTFEKLKHLLHNCTEMDTQCCFSAAAERLHIFHILCYQFINNKNSLPNLQTLKHYLEEGKWMPAPAAETRVLTLFLCVNVGEHEYSVQHNSITYQLMLSDLLQGKQARNT